MKLIRGTILILFLCHVSTKGSSNRQFKFLNWIIRNMERDRSLHTITVLKDSHDGNCTLQDWNSPRVPIVRYNEQTQIRWRATFNQLALALICIGNDSDDSRLLNHLAKTFDNMREERIILWMQRQPSEEFFQLIQRKVQELNFIQMLLLQMGEYRPVVYRLDAHPSPHFVRIENVSSIQRRVFLPNNVNFKGRTAIVDAKASGLDNLDLIKLDSRELFEFALKYNVTLKLYIENQTESFDIRLNPPFVTKKTVSDQLGYVHPLGSSSLTVMVPCAREMSLKEVFKQLAIRAWLFYIFCVYALLVLVETFILVVTYRISGRTYRPTRINPLVNLRAFGALLGMSFPVSSREVLSLRQLFLAMSIFGMVFSNFFSCKLSALLTKHSLQAQVRNFEELRASGLTVVVDPEVRSFIEYELQTDFFQRVMPRTKNMSRRERAILMLSMNESYGFVIFNENWPNVNNYQLSLGRKTYCTPPGLGIIENIPRASIVQKDSVFKWPLSQAVSRIQEAGIFQHWMQSKCRDSKIALNLNISAIVKPKLVPLSLEHLKLVWCLLLFGYGAAAIVFCFEVFLYQVKGRNRGTRLNCFLFTSSEIK